MLLAVKTNLALTCRLQIEQVNSDCTDSGDDMLALALRSLCFLSASRFPLLHTELLLYR